MSTKQINEVKIANNSKQVKQRANTLDLTKIVKNLQFRFEQAVRRHYNGPHVVSKGTRLYNAQVEFLYYCNEIIQGPTCLASQQISQCNSFINKELAVLLK